MDLSETRLSLSHSRLLLTIPQRNIEISFPYFQHASGFISAQSLHPKWSKHTSHHQSFVQHLQLLFLPKNSSSRSPPFVCLIDNLQRSLLLLFKHEDGNLNLDQIHIFPKPLYMLTITGWYPSLFMEHNIFFSSWALAGEISYS